MNWKCPKNGQNLIFSNFNTFRYVFYKYVFLISKIVIESFFDDCWKPMPTFMQLLSYLLNKLLHKVNCIKVGVAF